MKLVSYRSICYAFLLSLVHPFILSISRRYVDHTPNLKLWMASMKNDPIVSSLPTDVKTLRGFFNLYLQNSPGACDYGL